MNSSRLLAVSLLFSASFAAVPAQAKFATEEAHRIVGVFQKDLEREVASRFGARLEVSYITDLPVELVPYVAASADRYPGEWRMSAWGGSHLHPAITPDAFVLIFCHEAGHHVGGPPYKRDEHGAVDWPSVEGHSDYYATAVCAKRLFTLLPATASPPREMVAYCASRVAGKAEALLCARSIAAAQAVMTERAGRPFDWRAADPRAVSETVGLDPDMSKGGIYAYPAHDCMMETFRRGALCQAVPHPTVQDLLGVSGRERFCEGEAGRPSCWYAR